MGTQGTVEDKGTKKSEHQVRLALCSEAKAYKVLKKTVIQLSDYLAT